jgi:iodotyrosine deiodinase
MMVDGHKPLEGFIARSVDEMIDRSAAFRDLMKTRRTLRFFADTPVPRLVIEAAVATAHTAPSGANKQPWHFAIVGSAEIKRQIREAAEAEEREFYGGRAGDDWLEDLKPFGTDAHKPFLETAPWLIVVFQENYGLDAEGKRSKNYYIQESAGLASGFLLAALHQAGLATLTHTPSPMGFLRDLLGRPKNEKPIMIVVAGLPAKDATVPDLDKKPLKQVTSWF